MASIPTMVTLQGEEHPAQWGALDCASKLDRKGDDPASKAQCADTEHTPELGLTAHLKTAIFCL